MKKELIKYLIVIGIILISVIALVKARDFLSDNKITGNTISTEQKSTTPTGANIKRSAPTPTSCTRTQNCGSPTCGAARGGTCGASTGGSCGG